MDGVAPSDWPLAEQSRIVAARPHRWHVQQIGHGPDLLLLHGTGASTHSWRDLMPVLAQTHRCTAVDLPGHGFTRLGTRQRSSLETVSEDLHSLLQQEACLPRVIVGHSAGVAIALRLAQRLAETPPVIGINPALKPFEGLAGVMFPVAARMMALTPGMVDMLAWNMAQPGRIVPLLAGTGSDIPASGMNLYARLFRDKAHVQGTLLMMAQWKLDGLLADLPKMQTRCLFLTGSQDRMVPPVSAVQAAAQMPHAEVQSLDGYGHLVHEEAPALVAERITAWLATQ